MIGIIKSYYQLTKPGIIYGNLVVATGGFLLAAKGTIDFSLLASTLLGIAFIIAAAAIFNNYIDRDIDSLMARTKKRVLVLALVPPKNAIMYGCILGIAGFVVLVATTNLSTVLIGAIGLFSYVILYSTAKRRSIYGTLVGSISGAMPPVAGYTAVTGHLDMGALLLFLILVFWQMPHFYAIAIYRLKDYKAAKIPVLPAKNGIEHTKRQILFYITLFTLPISGLTIYGYTGYTFIGVMGVLSLTWLFFSGQGFRATNDRDWARKMFLFSLVVIISFSVLLSLDTILP